ncbi:MAG: penicillin-binding protein 2, partial [Coriobacteriia bacterium]|nr:penicillin-binding protein 2 [Coriobacteriia bacterium]
AVIPTALTGIHYLADSKRIYPYGRIGAQVIGAVGFDGYGISGIELAYDSILRGVNGVLVVERGKDTTPMVGGVQEKIVAINGQDIVLTIDIELQRYVENELERIAKAEDSENANALVLDGATGEIFAAASIPLYDRGNLTQAQVDAGATTLKCITTSFEPGSIFKTATAAAALETATVRPDDIIFCPSELTIYDYTIRDARPRSDQSMSFKTILVQSSNIGMSLIEERMGSSKHATYLAKYGFGQFTRIDYPGEACGILADVEKWTPIQAANISFGQGLQASSLQIASFYAAIANDGIYNQAHFLLACPQYNLYPTYDAREIVSSDTVADLEDMLCAVVSEGTGRSAAISGFQVAGKTGTAEKASPEGGYVKDEYIISFVGYIANSNSNLVCITSFDNPINSSSNLPSTFLFKTIMEFSINRYMIVPVEKTEATPGINASVGVVADGTGAMR